MGKTLRKSAFHAWVTVVVTEQDKRALDEEASKQLSGVRDAQTAELAHLRTEMLAEVQRREEALRDRETTLQERDALAQARMREQDEQIRELQDQVMELSSERVSRAR